jgi:hypothetical protein
MLSAYHRDMLELRELVNGDACPAWMEISEDSVIVRHPGEEGTTTAAVYVVGRDVIGNIVFHFEAVATPSDHCPPNDETAAMERTSNSEKLAVPSTKRGPILQQPLLEDYPTQSMRPSSQFVAPRGVKRPGNPLHSSA